jgi:hypothetical protein
MVMPEKVKKVEEKGDKEIEELTPPPSMESHGIWQDPIR